MASIVHQNKLIFSVQDFSTTRFIGFFHIDKENFAFKQFKTEHPAVQTFTNLFLESKIRPDEVFVFSFEEMSEDHNDAIFYDKVYYSDSQIQILD